MIIILHYGPLNSAAHYVVPVIPAGYNYYLHVILYYCVTFTSIGIRYGPSVGQFPPQWKRNEPKRARSDEDDNNISTRTRTIVQQQARIYTWNARAAWQHRTTVSLSAAGRRLPENRSSVFRCVIGHRYGLDLKTYRSGRNNGGWVGERCVTE